jgi:hypothetical protein
MPATHNGGVWLLVGLLTAVLAWGAWQITMAPLQSGDVYPPYSSLRSDPLGAKALFESLSALPQLTVTRLYKDRSPLDHGTTLLVLGVDSLSMNAAPKAVLEQYGKLLEHSGRIVIAFLPMLTPGITPASTAMEQEWHARLEYLKPSRNTDVSGIPRSSALYFNPGPEWRMLHRTGGVATAIEREMGGGALVLIADSYPLSNQGLYEFNDSALIATLIGGANHVIFDENQFGVTETGSAAGLIRKYRMEGAVAALFLFAALFVWRNASPFLPPKASVAGMAGDSSLTLQAEGSHEGLAMLLSRSIPPAELLGTCLAEWKRSKPPERQQELLETTIKQSADRSAVEGYRAACRSLSRRT